MTKKQNATFLSKKWNHALQRPKMAKKLRGEAGSQVMSAWCTVCSAHRAVHSTQCGAQYTVHSEHSTQCAVHSVHLYSTVQ